MIALGEADTWPSLMWKGAAVSMRTAFWPAGHADPADAAFGPAMPSRVESISVRDGVATLTLIDAGQQLRRPVIARQFGATGNALLDGPDVVDRIGGVIPIGWGRMLNVPGILVDRAYNIWLFLDRAATSVQGFYDGGTGIGVGVARADLAALRANTPADGCIDWALNAGGLVLARFWTDPTYVLTADLTAASETVADIAATIIGARTTLPLAAGTQAAFNGLQAAPAGLYVGDDRAIGDALAALFAGVGGWWKLNSVGEVVFGRYGIGAPTRSFAAHELVSIERDSIITPTRRRAIGYARNNRVHTEGEIATILLVDDIAGLGDLALQDQVAWGQVAAGGGRPEDGATVGAPSGTVVGGVLAETLVADATSAKASATAALADLTIIGSDAWLSRGEKAGAVERWQAIGDEYWTIAARAAALGLSGHSYYTLWTGARTALSDYLTALTPSWADTATDTAVVASVWRGRWADYYFARQQLLDLFVQVIDGAADAALLAADDARAIADGKIETFLQPTAPTAEGVGDLWIDTDDGNRLYRWNGAAWADAQDQEIGAALAAAAGAQATADGRITTFYGPAAPTANALGDLWSNTVDSGLYRWDGGSWLLLSMSTRGRGAWDDWGIDEPFAVGDILTRFGSSWRCRQAHTKTALNGPPVAPATSNTWWEIQAAAGAPGDDGLPGDPGPPAFGLVASLASWPVRCDAGGVPLSGAFTGASGQLQCRYAGADVTGSASFAVVAQEDCLGTVNSAGVYAFTAILADTGRLRLSATYDPPGADPAVTYEIVIPTFKSLAGAAAIRVEDDDVGPPGAGDTVISDTLLMPAGPGGTVSVSAWVSFTGTGSSGYSSVDLKAQRRLAGTSDPFVDVSIYVSGTPSVWDAIDTAWYGGTTSYGEVISGPPAQQIWEFRLVGRRNGQPVAIPSFAGTFSVSRTA